MHRCMADPGDLELSMSKRSWIAAAAFCAAMMLPAVAAAQSVAYAVYGGYTNVRAGPSTRYQVIARLAPGTPVEVLGCLQTRAWCNVLIEDFEGWVHARRLEFLYSGRRYLVPDYYSYFGAPYVIFRFGDRERRHRRDYDKPIFGHPGGGGPGPEYVAPQVEGPSGDPVDRQFFDTPGGGDPGPEYVAPQLESPGGAGPGPETMPPLEGVGPDGSGGVCPPGDPNCLQ